MKKARITFRTSSSPTSAPCGRSMLGKQELEAKTRRAKPAAEKTPNRAGATPLFRAFSRPKSVWGRSRPLAHSMPVIFPRRRRDFGINRKKGQHYATDQESAGHRTLEVKIEEPVSSSLKTTRDSSTARRTTS